MMATLLVDPFTTNAAGKRVLPSFSPAERNRRFGRLRQLMEAEGLDCMLAPAADVGEAQAQSRYLSQVGGVQGGAWVVFPVSGEPVAFVSSEREHAMWTASLEWPELRWGNFSDVVPERVRELGLERSRIGVAGMGSMRRAEGVIPVGTWNRITAALPNAVFVPAEEVMDRARVVKGPEEIAVIQKITDANEAAIARMMEVARPGMEEAAVWAEMACVLIGHTMDYPARLSLGSNGRPANSSNSMGLPITMEDGGVLSQEIDARLQGYRAQCNHSILIGSRNSQAYLEAMNGAIDLFLKLVDWVRPGKTVGELLDEYERLAAEAGGNGSGVLMHTNGLGDDRPRVGSGPMAHSRDWTIEPGWTFTAKTGLRITATGVYALVGEPMTVDERGARRLGHRRLEPFITRA